MTIARIAAIAIPPAWNGVWIAPSAHAHLQATGRDQRDRKQYRYHPVWANRRRRANYARLVDFSPALPAIRRYIDSGLRRPNLDKDRVLALALRLLDSGMIRIGNEEYLEAKRQPRAHDLAQERTSQSTAASSSSISSARAASSTGCSLHDARAARALRRCHELPGQRLFRYLDENRETHAITSSDINALLEDLTGQKFTAKDFRTWAGTVFAFGELVGREPGATEAETARIVNEVGVQTAEVLGNTLAVCKRYYIHPRRARSASPRASSRSARVARAKRNGMSRVEVALAKFLAGE